MRETAEIRSIVFLPPNAVYRGKITSIQPNYKDKVFFGVAEKSFKDSTSISNPLPILGN